MVLEGDPLDKIPQFCADYKIERLVFEKDTDEHVRSRDEKILELMAKCNVKVERYSGHTLWDLDEVRKQVGLTRGVVISAAK